MSLKQFEETIKNRPKLFLDDDGKPKYIHGYISGTMEWFEKVEVEFAKFKKECVCIPKNKLWDRRQDLVKKQTKTTLVTEQMLISGKIQMIDEIMPPKSIEQILGESK